jgi:uncharacterized membrane protein
MWMLLLGLVLFLGVHSVRVFAEGWRTAAMAKYGEGVFKGAYSLVSVAGFLLIVWGYGMARTSPVVLWTPPMATQHVAALLTLVAFVFLAATYVPRNAIRARLRHPMVLGVKVWALAHLLANGTLADVLLFGGFLVWAVLSFRAARQRDRMAGVAERPATSAAGTAAAVLAGVAAWAFFAFWAHGAWIGVRPFGA